MKKYITSKINLDEVKTNNDFEVYISDEFEKRGFVVKDIDVDGYAPTFGEVSPMWMDSINVSFVGHYNDLYNFDYRVEDENDGFFNKFKSFSKLCDYIIDYCNVDLSETDENQLTFL